jgi:hypothetical protein
MESKLVNALKLRYEAQKMEAIATLEVYLKNPVGIGEHPQIIEEMDKLVRSIADADGCLEALRTVIIIADKEEQING